MTGIAESVRVQDQIQHFIVTTDEQLEYYANYDVSGNICWYFLCGSQQGLYMPGDEAE